MLVLGSVGDDQKQPRRGQGLDETVEHDLRLGVDPVQIFDDDHERAHPALVAQEVLHRVLDPLPLLRGIEIPPRRIVDGDIE